MFCRLVTQCDLPPVRFLDLRHGASIVLTADTYTRALPCLAHQAAEASAALIFKAVRKGVSAATRKIEIQAAETTQRYGPPTDLDGVE